MKRSAVVFAALIVAVVLARDVGAQYGAGYGGTSTAALSAAPSASAAAVSCPALEFRHSLLADGRIRFSAAAPARVSWVDLHFRVNSGDLMNVRMAPADATGQAFEFAGIALNPASDQLHFFFTYSVPNGVECNSDLFAFGTPSTAPAALSAAPVSATVNSPAAMCPVIPFGQSLTTEDGVNHRIKFDAGVDGGAAWVDVHYRIGAGELVNARMVQVSARQFEHAGIALNPGDQLHYFFTYSAMPGVECNTDIFAFAGATHMPGALSMPPSPLTAAPSYSSPPAPAPLMAPSYGAPSAPAPLMAPQSYAPAPAPLSATPSYTPAPTTAPLTAPPAPAYGPPPPPPQPLSVPPPTMAIPAPAVTGFTPLSPPIPLRAPIAPVVAPIAVGHGHGHHHFHGGFGLNGGIGGIGGIGAAGFGGVGAGIDPFAGAGFAGGVGAPIGAGFGGATPIGAFDGVGGIGGGIGGVGAGIAPIGGVGFGGVGGVGAGIAPIGGVGFGGAGFGGPGFGGPFGGIGGGFGPGFGGIGTGGPAHVLPPIWNRPIAGTPVMSAVAPIAADPLPSSLPVAAPIYSQPITQPASTFPASFSLPGPPPSTAGMMAPPTPPPSSYGSSSY